MLAKAAESWRVNGDASVHSRRKAMKRLRAALRLLRAAIGNALYRTVNSRVRDAARPLTPVRDAAVLVKLCKDLQGTRNAGLYRAYTEPALRLLQDELESNRRNLTRKALRGSAAQLRRLSARLAGAPAKAAGVESMRVGFKKVFKRGRAAFARAQRHPANSTLHECRKQAKYLFYQTELLRKLLGADFKTQRRRSEKLSERLGEDHDLAVLQIKLEQFFERGLLQSGGAARVIFNRELSQRREKLQKKSFKLGKRLYRGAPPTF
jgi:CHAD domain-containing protein